jgi:transcriptional regulator with XRE-family HTH domain
MNNIFKEEMMKIGTKIKRYRINAELTQQDLADGSGVSVRSISRLEQGNSVQLESLIKILYALKLESNLDLLIPDQTKRPSYYIDNNKKEKQRVTKKTKKQIDFKWGDEQ